MSQSSKPDIDHTSDKNILRITRAKQEWEATVDALPQLICLLDEDGQIIRANRTVERWQLAAINEASHYDLHQLLHRDCEDSNCPILMMWDNARSFLRDESSYTIEIEDRVRDCVYDVQILPVVTRDETRDTAGSYASVIINDITARRKMETAIQEHLLELQRLNEEIKDLEQIKTDMIRLASHDLRNPLAAIKLSLGLLERNTKLPLADYHLKHVDRIRQSALGMQDIIDNILSLERIEDIHRHRMEVVDLQPLIRKVIATFQSQADAKSLRLDFHEDECSLYVAGESTLLEEVVTNFISNAIKYTPASGSVDIYAGMSGDKVEFKVVDSGIGIPEEEQSRVFDPFFRASTALAEKIDGIGVGLNVTRNVIERLDGEVLFHSVVNEGSTFGFVLPLHPM